MRHFNPLFIKSAAPETAHAVVLTFAIPPELRDAFAFQPGQFLTLKAQIAGEWVRRSYSICSSLGDFERHQEIAVAVKAVEGGVFSTWAQGLQAGQQLDAMPPDGRFVSQSAQATRRLFIAAGSGITPVLAMLRSFLETERDSHAQLVYGNQRLASVMFFEALQDLKNRHPERLSVTHVLSRQHLEGPLFNGRLDAPKLRELIANTVDVPRIDEAFVCGPEGVIEAAEAELVAAGMDRTRVHSERFASADQTPSSKLIATKSMNTSAISQKEQKISLKLIADGITHVLAMGADDTVLDVALEAGLDLPFSCKGGVCCTCRAKVLAGSVAMRKNFTLQPAEVAQGFVLTCQSCPTSAVLEVSFDER